MKIFLYVIAIVAIIGPLAGWTYLASFRCAYNVGSNNCGISFSDFWDVEFIAIAILPWMFGIVCLTLAIRKRSD